MSACAQRVERAGAFVRDDRFAIVMLGYHLLVVELTYRVCSSSSRVL